ncbi:Carboxylase:pyruvate/acetyl-CoA/propionyl-CoA [Taphrina deformans PYCC 5710]|uniref:Carboxylase:pyruvate/acetyl-CoA/propionyl-CoA n=1 Tax=Taphrina deformans (strain PYCC 5710 / ATCC 11124 / CBS 356.35 / IMI 108563 / JCM 9778 / NBRC 8474) TaxID=1097556 RepID=R4XBR4_TAPDE|nr:Carboxylase:pyruvate/acetyl-CoA/propionyl-CoA [Taphrina deformans PYCC 5710]|eukprot:CCG83305.1 Carboxylase:pyruvate/acetyl-CoA/propionyl-CoA [Taphrina deformans PYCC 5710]
MRVLVTNRGEIAIRLLQALEELNIVSVAIHTAVDRLHVGSATDVVEIPEASSYMDIELLLRIARDKKCTAILPGYGFLSESHEFASKCEEHGLTFIGPSARVLRDLGDKSRAKKIAESLRVPILPYQTVSGLQDIKSFAKRVGYPIMIKAQDGGGGKGIRIVRQEGDANALMKEAMNESPSRQIFVEKAALEGYKHIEVQIIGDHFGNVQTLFERECSLQRNFQKIVEFAPSSLSRTRIQPLEAASIKIAQHVGYVGLGTFEFLVNSHGTEYYFMECNPRIQVEHTVTEQITGLDLVHLLLRTTLQKLDLQSLSLPRNPAGYSIQSRINAEDPTTFAPTQGPVTEAKMPTGAGIRVDSILSGLERGTSYVATDEYDTLLAKVITTSNTYVETLRKAIYALKGFQVQNFKTNQSLLLGIMTSDLMSQPQVIDVRSLSQAGLVPRIVEAGARHLIQHSEIISKRKGAKTDSATNVGSSGQVSASALFKKGDSYNYTLDAKTTKEDPKEFKIVRILKNNFPEHLSADISLNGKSMTLQIEKSTGSTNHRKADQLDASHIGLPFAGIFVEMLVDPGDEVDEAETIAVFRQGKMELDVRAPCHGVIVEVASLTEGEPVGSGALIAVISPSTLASSTSKL